MYKALEYGVLGLCAIMAAYAVGIIYREQKRKERPRKAILTFGYLFMSFCLVMAGLSAWVQTRTPADVAALQSALERHREDTGGQKVEIKRLEQIIEANNVDTLKQDLAESKELVATQAKQLSALQEQIAADQRRISKAAETTARVRSLAGSLGQVINSKSLIVINNAHTQDKQNILVMVELLRKMALELADEPTDTARKAALP